MRSEATLRALLENTPSMMGVVELAPDGDDVLHLLSNAHAERFFGVEPGGTANRWARGDLGASAETVRPWIDAYREARRTGQPLRFAFRFDAAPADSRWMDVSVSYMGPGGDGRDRFCYTAIDDTERRRAEDALRRAEERFRASQEASLFGFVILRAVRADGGRIVDFEWEYVNPAAVALRRRPAEHFLGRRMSAVVPNHEQTRALIERYARVVETGEPLDYEMPYEGPGIRGWFRNTAVRLGDGVAVSIADITSRKQAEQRLALLADAGKVLADARDVPNIVHQLVRLSLPTFADWCVVDFVGEDGAIERIAAAHADPDKEPLVRALRDRAPTSWDADSPLVRVLKSGRPELLTRDDCPARDDERARALAALEASSAIVVPLAARGRTFGAIAWVRGGPVGYEQADVDVAHELARRAAAAVDNARLFQQITASDRRKDEFLATMAHELRNPLAPICNAVAVMAAKGPPDPELVWSREVIARQVGQMARLLDDLLDVSRITRNKLELRRQRVTLADVIDSAVETSRPLLDAHGHTLTVALPDAPVVLDGDPVRLAQVFSNLLNNAAKYTDRGGRVRLSAERRADAVTVAVADTGIGIARETLPRLFEMFSQAAPAIDRSQGGLGIGLALVKGLVQMHGGGVEARSDGPGRGSTFLVTLPVAAAAASPPTRPPDPPPPARAGARTIVVADDNLDAAESLALWLEVHGRHDVRVAHDGRQALAVTAELRPDVVLLDIGMPGLNGYEVARSIREQPWGAAIVLVALTGWGQEEDKRRAREAGFDRHMTKPVDPVELERVLSELAAARRP